MAVVGAGRIGALHARNIAGAVDGAVLVAAVDAIPESAQRVAVGGAYATSDLNKVLADPAVEAVLIASPTPLHAEQIAAAAAAEKAIFCEKPVALELGATLTALDTVRAAGVPFQIGFNRRYDPGYAEVARAVHAGELGQVEMVRSQSTDPATPPESLRGDVRRDLPRLGHPRHRHGPLRRRRRSPGHGPGEGAGRALHRQPRRRRHQYRHPRVHLGGARGASEQPSHRLRPRPAARGSWRAWQAGVRGGALDGGEALWDRRRHLRLRHRLHGAVSRRLPPRAAGLRQGGPGRHPPSPGPEAATESLRVALAAGRSLREGRPVEVVEITA